MNVLIELVWLLSMSIQTAQSSNCFGLTTFSLGLVLCSTCFDFKESQNLQHFGIKIISSTSSKRPWKFHEICGGRCNSGRFSTKIRYNYKNQRNSHFYKSVDGCSKGEKYSKNKMKRFPYKVMRSIMLVQEMKCKYWESVVRNFSGKCERINWFTFRMSEHIRQRE